MHPGFKNIPYAENSEPIKENNRHYRRFLAEAGAYLAFRGDGSLIKRGPTIRRLLALALLNGGNLRMRMSWIAPFAALYMTQLERAAHDSIR
jgi:hypothetical protein